MSWSSLCNYAQPNPAVTTTTNDHAHDRVYTKSQLMEINDAAGTRNNWIINLCNLTPHVTHAKIYPTNDIDSSVGGSGERRRIYIALPATKPLSPEEIRKYNIVITTPPPPPPPSPPLRPGATTIDTAHYLAFH